MRWSNLKRESVDGRILQLLSFVRQRHARNNICALCTPRVQLSVHLFWASLCKKSVIDRVAVDPWLMRIFGTLGQIQSNSAERLEDR